MKTIDEHAKEASRQIGRWYGALGTFERYIARDVQVPTCEEWLKAHWRRFPAASPDAPGRRMTSPAVTIDHDTRVFFSARPAP